MKLTSILHLLYYICLIAFICFIPQASIHANIFKIVLFLLTIGIFILLCTFYIVISFNRKYAEIKKYANSNVVCMVIGIVSFLTFGHMIYRKTNSFVILAVIFGVLFVGSHLLQFKITNNLANNQFDLMEEVKLFSKMGHSLDKTPLMNASSKMDIFFFGYAVAVGVADNLYVFASIVGIILILSMKHLKVVMQEFFNSGLISAKETYFSLFSYYFCYLISIVWFIFFPNLSTLLIGGSSLITIKIFIKRIAIKVYDEKNNFS
ncbi:hypothetical protein [Niallia sp. 03133]|uniref:hypothetical protein n=1 Tax=Niallia sp. 03133 TaxID=3458060 RepID=UPI00404485DF